MSRCKICDWTPYGEQSDYFLCLPEAPFSLRKNYLITNEEGHMTICANCANEATNAMIDFDGEDE